MTAIRIAAVLAAVLAVTTGSALAYEAAPVTDGGTIKGKVVYSGPVSTRKIVPTKDQATCGQTREEPEIAVGPDKGVKDAIVFLKGVQKGKPIEKPAKKPEINNLKCVFEPRVQAVPLGTVVVVNSDPVMHNTHAFHGKATVFNVALPTKGQRVERPMNKPGLNRIECDTHGWMLAWVYTADSPYYAVTQKDGGFSISDVPPGSYTLVAWHELTGEQEIPVTVKPKETTQLPIELKKR